jgi:histidinol phosphatase-like PHP family hydrolase
VFIMLAPEAEKMGSLYDFHIHTTYLKCANETMTVPALMARSEELGIKTLAITDHLNAPEYLDQHFRIKEDLAALDSPLEIFFGVEVNVRDKDTGEVTISPQEVDEAGFTVVIGGVHGSYHDTPDIRSIVDLQHRLMLQVIANPLIDVLVHPWWFNGNELAPDGSMGWFTDMSQIPEDYTRELAEAAVAHNTAIEANGAAIWTNDGYTDEFKEQYTDYMVALSAAGAKISLGSDAHNIGHLDGVHQVADLLASRGIVGDKLWRPDPALAFSG